MPTTAYGMPCGLSVGNYNGTLGFPARDRATGAAVAVTASHVVTRFGRHPPGTLVYADGVGLVGAVCRDAAPVLDAACITLLPGVVDPVWRWPGGDETWEYGGVREDPPKSGQWLWKAGKTTGSSYGRYQDTLAGATFDPNNDGHPVTVGPVGVVAPWWPPAFAAPGDSGAAVVDARSRVVGLVVAVTAGGQAYYHPVADVLAALDLDPY